MKSVNDIEKLSLEDLERISLDESIEVPSGLESRILDSTLGQQQAVPVERSKEAWFGKFGKFTNRKSVRIIGIAASVAIVAGIGFAWLNRPQPLQDTFDDPLLAYAAVENALNKMASTVEVGFSSVAMSEDLLRKPGEVIQSINNK